MFVGLTWFRSGSSGFCHFAYFGLRFVVLLFGSVWWFPWVFDIWVVELLYFGILAGFLFSGGFLGFCDLRFWFCFVVFRVNFGCLYIWFV